jgi:hypothetical protein
MVRLSCISLSVVCLLLLPVNAAERRSESCTARTWRIASTIVRKTGTVSLYTCNGLFTGGCIGATIGFPAGFYMSPRKEDILSGVKMGTFFGAFDGAVLGGMLGFALGIKCSLSTY